VVATGDGDGDGDDDGPLFIRPAPHNSSLFRSVSILCALLFAMYQGFSSSAAAPAGAASANGALRRFAGKYYLVPRRRIGPSPLVLDLVRYRGAHHVRGGHYHVQESPEEGLRHVAEQTVPAVLPTVFRHDRRAGERARIYRDCAFPFQSSYRVGAPIL
jgi:hypothetical protein